MTKWRDRVGKEGCERMLSVTIQAGLNTRTVKSSHLKSVTVDNTPLCQEKAVTCPTEGKLFNRCENIWCVWRNNTVFPYVRTTTEKAPALLLRRIVTTMPGK